MGYHKLSGKMEFQGLPISIEQSKGGKRYWTDESTGEEGCTVMEYPYGYIRGTLGTDGDEVDVFVGPNKQSEKVFVITQNEKPEEGKAGSKPWVETDEQKVMLGFDGAEEAQAAYLKHYDDSRFFGNMIELTMGDFKERLESCKGKLIKNLTSGIGSNHPLLPESLRGTEQLGWFTNPDYLPPHTRLFVENNQVILKKTESDKQVGQMNDPSYKLERLKAKLHQSKVSKGLKEDSSPDIMLENNISMFTLSKSVADKKFTSSEEVSKKQEHPVSEDQRRWAYAAEERGELPEGTAEKWSERVEGKDLPKDTSKGISMKLSDELCKGFGYDDPTDFLYKFPEDSPLHKEAVKLMEECLALEKEMQKHSNDREKLWRKKDKLSLKKDELLFKQYKKDNKVSKSTRGEAVEVLKKAQASINEKEMDLKKKEEASKSKEEDDNDYEEDTNKSLKKALKALAVSGMSKRARMDAAYQVGQAAGRKNPFSPELVKVQNLNVGTDRPRPTHEPPVVPVRRVETPVAETKPSEVMKSCTVHGYVHKSDSSCPLCVQAQTAEAAPFWRR